MFDLAALRQPKRFGTPLLEIPSSGMVTYSIQQPLTTHFRTATCEEANCTNWRNGFSVNVQRTLALPQGGQILHMVRKSGKKFSEQQVSEGNTNLVFEPGQSCFDGDMGRHVVNVQRPPLLIVRGGDYRGNPRGDYRVHTSPQSWADDMQSHRDRLLSEAEKG